MSPASTEVGVTVHFVASGLTVHTSESLHSIARVMLRGDTLVITPEVRAANTDRFGRCCLDLPAVEQARRFGMVHFLPGELPPSFERLEPGSPQWDAARQAAYLDAGRISDPDEQRRAAARVRERFGSSSAARSRTLVSYDR